MLSLSFLDIEIPFIFNCEESKRRTRIIVTRHHNHINLTTERRVNSNEEESKIKRDKNGFALKKGCVCVG